MSSSITFDGLKAAILNRMKKIDLCPGYQEAMLATTRSQLIAAAADLIMWCYRSNVVDDYLISQFTDVELNAYGIYIGVASITNPDTDIYLLANADVIVTLNGNSQSKIFLGGQATAEIITAANAYVEITAHETSDVSITMSSASLVKIIGSNNASFTVTADNTTVMHARLTDASNMNYTGNGESFAMIKAYNSAQVYYSAVYPAIADLQKFNAASLNERFPSSDIS